MTLKRERWRITKIAHTAQKNIKILDFKAQREILERFDDLQANPFLKDVKKIEGQENIYRGRIGDYRYYFRLFSKSKPIEILLFEPRGRIKLKKIQRLR